MKYENMYNTRVQALCLHFGVNVIVFPVVSNSGKDDGFHDLQITNPINKPARFGRAPIRRQTWTYNRPYPPTWEPGSIALKGMYYSHLCQMQSLEPHLPCSSATSHIVSCKIVFPRDSNSPYVL